MKTFDLHAEAIAEVKDREEQAFRADVIRRLTNLEKQVMGGRLDAFRFNEAAEQFRGYMMGDKI